MLWVLIRSVSWSTFNICFLGEIKKKKKKKIWIPPLICSYVQNIDKAFGKDWYDTTEGVFYSAYIYLTFTVPVTTVADNSL